MKLCLEKVTIAQGAFRAEFDFTLCGGAVAVAGPSGCGKTTLIEAVAGLRPCRGRMTLDGRVLSDSALNIHVPPRERRIGYVPQDLALFPHMDTEANLRFGMSGPGGADFAVVVEALELGDHLKSSVGTLSGGERKRVALGRALLARPQLLLLDEPTANLDDDLRRQVATLLKRTRRDFKVPLLLVSHDPAEIFGLCTEVAVLAAGRCKAVGSPRRLLRGKQGNAASLTGVSPASVRRKKRGPLDLLLWTEAFR